MDVTGKPYAGPKPPEEKVRAMLAHLYGIRDSAKAGDVELFQDHIAKLEFHLGNLLPPAHAELHIHLPPVHVEGR